MAAITIEEQKMSETELDPGHWTVPQELCLLQAITDCKPVGLHKHFRMLNIIETLQNSGTIPQHSGKHKHCSTSDGIWRKLESLYDLKALDEREDAIFADLPNDSEDGAAAEYWREFELKGNDFEQQMWDRRLAPAGDEDWSEEDRSSTRMRESTVADSEDPRSSPVGSVRGVRSSGRRTATRRLAEMKQDGSPAGSTGKNSRRTSKAATPSIRDEEDTEMHDVDDEDEGDNDDEEDSEQEEMEHDSKKGMTTRARGVRRGRGRRGRRGR